MSIHLTRASYDIVGARVVGSKHAAQDIPCQDYFVFDKGPDWAVAVVSDGAGSVPRALDGAQCAAAEICSTVSAKVRDNALRHPVRTLARSWLKSALNWQDPWKVKERILDQLKDAVIVGIERARERCLLEAADGQRLESFHATVVGAVLFGEIGLLFHIGDGGASAYRGTSAGIQTIAFSEPENGEYINQTFFYTESAWFKHLRFTEIAESTDAVWLMTDGAYQLMVAPNSRSIRDITAKEIDRLIFEQTSSDKSTVLAEILSSSQAAGRNADDKTLVIIRRHKEACRA